MNAYRTTIELEHEARNIASASTKVEQIVASIRRKPGVHVQHVHTASLTSDEKREAA